MSIYSIHAGHNFHVTGAHGFIKEEVIDRKIKNAVIKYLRIAKQTVYDDTDENGKTQQQNLTNIVNNINSHGHVALAVSIHLNAGNGTGFEVYEYDHKSDSLCLRIMNSMCKVVPIVSRGVKIGNDLYVIKHAKPTAILIECGFVDTKNDSTLISTHIDQLGKAIAEGIIGMKIESKTTVKPFVIVADGDSLWKIAHEHKTTVDVLKKINHLKSDVIQPKQKLYLK